MKFTPSRFFTGIFLALMAGVSIISVVLFNARTGNIRRLSTNETNYDRHYAFISSDSEDNFYTAVFEAARESFEADGDYLEFMGKNLNTPYSRYDLMKIAMGARLNGIFVESDDSEEMKELIGRADTLGIPVITMGVDNTSSKRKSFVGFGYYDVGQNYGKELLKQIHDDPQTVLILMDQGSENAAQNIIFQGIRDTIDKSGNMKYFKLRTLAISDAYTFGAQESISSLIMGEEELPDIIICLNELYTTCVAQALVDYNRVGETSVYGFYTNHTILSGIEKNIITATVTVDTKQMGKYLAEAIQEYESYGFVNEYMPADIEVITAENVGGYLNAGEEENVN